MLLVSLSTFAQSTYTYKDLTVNVDEVTLSSLPEKMEITPYLNAGFTLRDSIMTLDVSMDGRNISYLTIHNNSNSPLIVRYQNLFATTTVTIKGGFTKAKEQALFFNIAPGSDITDPSKGEETIYPEGKRFFVFREPHLLVKKVYFFNNDHENVTLNLNIPLVVNGREKTYNIKFVGHNSKSKGK